MFDELIGNVSPISDMDGESKEDERKCLVEMS